MTRKARTLTSLHFRLDQDHLAVLDTVARHEQTTVSQLARKIVAEWIRALPKQQTNLNKEPRP